MEMATAFMEKRRQGLPKAAGSVLLPARNPWLKMLKGLEMFTDDFLADEIPDIPVQERASL